MGAGPQGEMRGREQRRGGRLGEGGRTVDRLRMLLASQLSHHKHSSPSFGPQDVLLVCFSLLCISHTNHLFICPFSPPTPTHSTTPPASSWSSPGASSVASVRSSLPPSLPSSNQTLLLTQTHSYPPSLPPSLPPSPPPSRQGRDRLFPRPSVEDDGHATHRHQDRPLPQRGT